MGLFGGGKKGNNEAQVLLEKHERKELSDTASSRIRNYKSSNSETGFTKADIVTY